MHQKIILCVIKVARMSFQSCINENKLEKISSGEVCTINSAKAKNLGIFDPKEYFPKNKFTTLKTFNSVKDAEDTRYHSLCSVNTSKGESYPHCQVQYGIGFTNKPSLKPTCITAECPTGFTQDDKDPTICHKPLVEYVVPLGTKNEERWYDWFTIRNYHLGNTYGSSNFGPCPDDTVPFYARDPVDGTNMDFTSRDDLSKCISKDIYFGGKYANSSDFCPSAIIKRLSSTKRSLTSEASELFEKIQKDAELSPRMTDIEQNNAKIADQIMLMIDNDNLQENVSPLSYEMINACKKINTEERLSQVYPVCEAIAADEEKFKQSLLDIEISLNEQRPANKRKSMKEMEERARIKTLLIKKSCHSLFCNKMDDAAKQIDKPLICFPDIEAVNMEQEIKKYQESVEESNKPLPIISSNADKDKLKKNIVKNSIQWIKFAVFIIICIFLYYVVWPWFKVHILPRLKKIIRFLTFGKVFREIEGPELVEAKLAAEKSAEAAKVAAANSAETAELESTNTVPEAQKPAAPVAENTTKKPSKLSNFTTKLKDNFKSRRSNVEPAPPVEK